MHFAAVNERFQSKDDADDDILRCELKRRSEEPKAFGIETEVICILYI